MTVSRRVQALWDYEDRFNPAPFPPCQPATKPIEANNGAGAPAAGETSNCGRLGRYARGTGGGAPGLVTTGISPSELGTDTLRTATASVLGRPANGPALNRRPPKPSGRQARRKAREANPAGFSDAPRYVTKCSQGAWHLLLHRFDPRTGELGDSFRKPFKCCAWRHPGECRRKKAAQNFSRVNAALLRYQAREVVFMVLTVKPSQYKSRYEAFRALCDNWGSLAKAINREWGRFGYVATVEVTKAGWAHLNVLLCSSTLSRAIGRGCRPGRNGMPARSPGASGWRGVAWLKKHAVLCGFGPMLSVEPAGSRRAAAGYVVKIAGEVEEPATRESAGQSAGEVVKWSQLPEKAPAHFRRIRSSVRFLPKVLKREGITGELIKSPLPEVAAVQTAAMLANLHRDHASKSPQIFYAQLRTLHPSSHGADPPSAGRGARGDCRSGGVRAAVGALSGPGL